MKHKILLPATLDIFAEVEVDTSEGGDLISIAKKKYNKKSFHNNLKGKKMVRCTNEGYYPISWVPKEDVTLKE